QLSNHLLHDFRVLIDPGRIEVREAQPSRTSFLAVTTATVLLDQGALRFEGERGAVVRDSHRRLRAWRLRLSWSVLSGETRPENQGAEHRHAEFFHASFLRKRRQLTRTANYTAALPPEPSRSCTLSYLLVWVCIEGESQEKERKSLADRLAPCVRCGRSRG